MNGEREAKLSWNFNGPRYPQRLAVCLLRNRIADEVYGLRIKITIIKTVSSVYGAILVYHALRTL